MSEEFKIEIVNPDKSFLSKDNVTEVIVPAFEGEIGILKDHISIISFLKPGIIKIYSKSEEEKYLFICFKFTFCFKFRNNFSEKKNVFE